MTTNDLLRPTLLGLSPFAVALPRILVDLQAVMVENPTKEANMELMKGIYFDGERATYREDLPIPVPEEGQSLIRILMAAVCSTDKEILKGYRPDFKGVMGHEFVGVVESSDDASLVGRRVVGEINENCGHCLYCTTGRPHHCSNRHTPGLSKDGCFAQYMTLRTNLLHVVPDGLETDVAVFTEPLAAAFEILEQVNMKAGTPVAVIGDGRLALCIANVMHMAGADLSIVGKHSDKLEVFKPLGNVLLHAEPQNFEIVIEASGHPSGMETALRIVRRKGTIVLKSTFAAPVSLNLSQVPVEELSIIGSRCGPFEPALKALSSRQVVLPPLERHPLEDFEGAFSSTAFKAGFEISS